MKLQQFFRGAVWIILIALVGINAWLIKINVLGAQTSQPSDLIQHEKSLEAEYRYWVAVVEDHPDYRDGFVRLATLAYQRGERAKSGEFIERIRALDPNFAGLKELEALLQTR